MNTGIIAVESHNA